MWFLVHTHQYEVLWTSYRYTHYIITDNIIVQTCNTCTQTQRNIYFRAVKTFYNVAFRPLQSTLQLHSGNGYQHIVNTYFYRAIKLHAQNCHVTHAEFYVSSSWALGHSCPARVPWPEAISPLSLWNHILCCTYVFTVGQVFLGQITSGISLGQILSRSKATWIDLAVGWSTGCTSTVLSEVITQYGLQYDLANL